MATLTTKLTLSSSDTLSDALNVTITDSLSVTNPIEFSKKSIATGSAQSVIASNSAFSYVYLKVISGENSSDWLQVKIDGNVVAKIRVGEFMWVPLSASLAITAEAQGGACVTEYGYWSIA